MKHAKKQFTLFLVLALIVTSLLPIQPAKVEAAAKVSISATKLTVQEKKSTTLTVKNTTSKVSWKLSTKKYITIKSLQKNKIKITGKKAGVTKITASVGKKKFTCKVTVKKASSKPSTAPSKPSTEPEKTTVKLYSQALKEANKTETLLAHHSNILSEDTSANEPGTSNVSYMTKDLFFLQFGVMTFYEKGQDMFSRMETADGTGNDYILGIPVYLEEKQPVIELPSEINAILWVVLNQEPVFSGTSVNGTITVSTKLTPEYTKTLYEDSYEVKDTEYGVWESVWDEKTLELQEYKEYLCDSAGKKEWIQTTKMSYDVVQPEKVTKMEETYAAHKACENMEKRTVTLFLGAGTTQETTRTYIIPKGDAINPVFDDAFEKKYDTVCYTDPMCTVSVDSYELDKEQDLNLYFKLKEEDVTESDTVQYADGVTEKMTNPQFWAELSAKPDTVLATIEQIEQVNAQALAKSETNKNDLKNITETYNGVTLRENLANSIKTAANRKAYFANGVAVDKETYFAEIAKNITDNTSVTETDTVKYAVCTKRTEVKWCPTPDFVGYSATDTDNESVNSVISINDPMVIKMQTADGKYYWGYTENCTGWVASEDMAICSSKEEWLDAWDVDATQKNFLVVTTDRIVTETSFYQPDISAKILTLGTRLKLVEKENIPQTLDGRGTWNNYVVYLPTRTAEGAYAKKMAMISQHSNVSVGYLPFTERNVLKVAYECLGNRYGWGGSLDAMDCSYYVYAVYRCFGFSLPRNTSWQQKMDSFVSITGKTDEEKTALIKQIPVGSVLYFSGHEMLYLGRYHGRTYVMSALGSVCDVPDTTVKSVFSVAINTLDVKRKNGNTWLTELTGYNAFQFPMS